MGDSEDKEATGSEQFEVAGLSRRALLDRMKALGLGFGAAYMLGITNADAAAPSGGTARIRSNDEAIDAIIEEGEGAADRTQVADAGGDNNYSRSYNRGDYNRGYSRGYNRDYSRDYNRGYSRDSGYSRGYSRDYSRGGYSRGYSRWVGGRYGRSGHYGHYGHNGRYGHYGHRPGRYGNKGGHYGNKGGHYGNRGGGRGGRGGGRGGHGGGGRGGHGGGGRGGGRRSDIRSKDNVVLLGHLANGLGFYRFNYITEDTTYVGVMAQEVLAVKPDAVVRGSDGYLRVFYEKLGLQMQTFEEWKSDGGKIPTPVH